MHLLVIALLFIAYTAACIGGGYAKGSQKYNEEIAREAAALDKIIVITKVHETTRIQYKDRDRVVAADTKAKVEDEIKKANIHYPTMCYVSTGVLNTSIDNANSTVKLHGGVEAPQQTSGPKQS